MIDPNDGIAANFGRQIIRQFNDDDRSITLECRANFVRVRRSFGTPCEPVVVDFDIDSPGQHSANLDHFEIATA